MQDNIAQSFKNLEGDQGAAPQYVRSNRRRNACVITPSSPEFDELQKKIHEPSTQSSFGSIGSVPSTTTM